MILSLEWVVIKKRTDRQLSYIYSYFILSRLWKIAVVIAIVSEYVLDRIFSIFKWEFIHFSQNNQEIHIFFTFPYSIIRSWHHLYTSKSLSTFLTLHVCWVVVFKPDSLPIEDSELVLSLMRPTKLPVYNLSIKHTQQTVTILLHWLSSHIEYSFSQTITISMFPSGKIVRYGMPTS